MVSVTVSTTTSGSTDTLTTEEVVEETAVEPEVVVETVTETTTPTQPSFTYYTVKPYDTLQSVSFKFAVNRFAVADANGLSVDSRLSVGQVIKIPN